MFNKLIPTLPILLALSLGACSSNDMKASNDNQTPKNTGLANKELTADSLSAHVDNALTLAISKSDYRLLHSKGRRVVLPGLEHYDLTLLKRQCGIKALANSSDVFRNEEQKQQHKLTYTFAKQYNQHIYTLCLENITE